MKNISERENRAQFIGFHQLLAGRQSGCGLMLESYLRHHPRPQTVVLCWRPCGFGPPLDPNILRWVRERFLRVHGPRDDLLRSFTAHSMSQSAILAIRELVGSTLAWHPSYADQPIPDFGGYTYNELRRVVAAATASC